MLVRWWYGPGEAVPTDVRLLRNTTRSDDEKVSAGPRSQGKRVSRSLTTALWKKAVESVAVKRGSDEYRVMATVAFWIGSFFIIGSLLFIIGAAASIVDALADAHITEGGLLGWQYKGLVVYAYFTGGSYYTVGAYLGWFHVINAGNGFDHDGHGFEKLRWWAGPPSASDGHGNPAYWGSLSYFVGAIFFQVAVMYAVFAPAGYPLVALLVEYLSQVIGGAFFVIGASIEYNHNRNSTPKDRVWWLVVTYWLGSFLFWFGATAYFTKTAVGNDAVRNATGLEPETISLWLVNIPYLVGSVSFWVGSWVQLRMWKAEQHGLGFMSEMNSVLSKGARPIDGWDQAVLMATTLLATGTVLNLGLVFAYNEVHVHDWEKFTHSPIVQVFSDVHDTLSSFIPCVTAHAILLLKTVLHASPNISPYDYLIGVMTLVTFLFLVHEILTSIELLFIPHEH